jgi:hypothetical protein
LYAVSAKRPTIDVTSIVENELQEKLQTVTGVGDVIVYGGRRREIHIYANPDRLRAYNLTVSDVAQALRAQNMELPAGRIDAGAQELSIRALGRIERAGQFSDLVIKTVNGYPIRVRRSDVGERESGQPIAFSRELPRGVGLSARTVGLGARPCASCRTLPPKTCCEIVMERDERASTLATSRQRQEGLRRTHTANLTEGVPKDCGAPLQRRS